jgi:hypothetical protein
VTAFPPALFDLEPEAPESAPTITAPARTIRRRPGHQLEIIPGQYAVCSCTERSPWNTADDPDRLTRWVYKHLGVVYDTDIQKATA